jgi:long-chain acyl-CoA synthetase
MTFEPDPSEPRTLLSVLEYRASHSGAERFVVTPDYRERTYAEIMARAKRLGESLAQSGVARGDRVGLYFENGPAWVVAVFATWICGATAAACGRLVPVDDATAMLRLAGCTFVVTTQDEESFTRVFRPFRVTDEGELAQEAPCAAAAAARGTTEPSEDDAATIIFSSGTTGAPKGIPTTHKNYITNARQQSAAFTGSAKFRLTAAPGRVPPHIIFSPFGHGSPFGQLAFRLWIGRPVVMVRKFSVDVATSLIERYRPTTLQLSPAMIHMFADSESDCDMSSLKYISSTNDALPASTRQQFESRYSVPIFQAYGLSETGVIAQDRPDPASPERRRPGSSGVLAPGVQVRIMADGVEVGPGVDGEIVVFSLNMKTDYIGGQRAEVVDGWLHTGDIGHLDEDGYLYVTGRSLEKLVVGGLNVYPAEVEESVRESPLVRDAIVIGVPDERLGEIPVVGVVWAGAREPETLLSEVRDRIAHYKAPRKVFDLDAVPLTPRGKVDRRTAKAYALAVLQ